MDLEPARTVDTPDHVLISARTLLGWTLRTHRTTYSAVEGVRAELRLDNNGGAPISRSAFRSNLEWEVTEFRCVARSREAVVWVHLRRRLG